MDRWRGKVAVITGANSGIGLAVTKRFLQNGLIVAALDRNLTSLQDLLNGRGEGNEILHPLNVDLSHDDEVIQAFQWIEQNLGGIDILINNAGMCGQESLLDGSPKEWRQMLDVNIVALCFCTHLAVKSMRNRKIEEGHIINMSSNLSRFVPSFPPFHFYSATKHAIQALTEGYRQELKSIDDCIKISSICPGLVKTSIFQDSLGEALNKFIYGRHPFMEPDDIASAIEYVLAAPPHVQVHDLNIRPAKSEN